jgi:hypothetical protein
MQVRKTRRETTDLLLSRSHDYDDYSSSCSVSTIILTHYGDGLYSVASSKPLRKTAGGSMAGNNSSAPKPTSVRLTGENLERLAYAEKLGLSQSTVVNTLLKLHLRDYLMKVREEKIEEIREALDAPVP